MTGAAAVAQVVWLLALLSGSPNSSVEKEKEQKKEEAARQEQVMKLIEIDITVERKLK